MTRLLTSLMIVLMLLVMPSCEESRTHGTMRINLEKGTRSIVPSGYPLEVEEYRITGTGPQGADFKVETERTSITVEGLISGEWVLEAEGMNAHGDVMVRGSTVFSFSSSNTNATITLDKLMGKGSLNVTLKWDPSLIIGEAEVTLSIRPQYGSDTEKVLELTTFSEHSGTATYKGSDYEAGSYILSAKLYDNGILAAGCAEAVRIAGDQESKGEIVFDLDKNPTEPGTLEITNSTGVPVKFTIEGIEDTVEADTPVSVSLVSETESVDNFQVSWHLNGEKIGEGSVLEFTPPLGVHRLDAVASSSLIGSTGSTSVNFEAVTSVAEGVPNQGGVARNGTGGLKLGADTLVRFMPDGNLMIFSNASKAVQIGRIMRSSIHIEHEISFSSLGINGTVTTFAVEEYSSSIYKVIVGVKDPFSVKLYNYSPNNHAMTKVTEAGSGTIHIDTTIEQDVPVAYCDFATIGMKFGNRAIVTIFDRDRKYANYYVFKIDETTPENFAITNYTVFDSYTNGVLPYDSTYSKDGFALMANKDGTIIVRYRDNVVGIEEGYVKSDDLEFIENPTGMAFTSSKSVLVQTSEYLSILGQESQMEWDRKSSIPLQSSRTEGLASSPDYEFAYYVDQEENELVTLEILDNGMNVMEIARTPLEISEPDEIIISPSGINMVLYDSNNPDELAIMRIKR